MLAKRIFHNIKEFSTLISFRFITNKSNENLNKALETVKPSLKHFYDEQATPLVDTFGRHHSYLRISLTERCNLRCTYCMPEEGVKLTSNDRLLNANEIVSLVKLFARCGVNKIRFTGGEPLVRKDCLDIIGQVSRVDGIEKVAMTTNGILLARKINDLKLAGLNQLNISLDTLEEKKFEFIAKRRGWSKVMNSIEASLNVGYRPLKLNCVVMKGINDDEIVKFIEFTRDKEIDVRFIEYMPFDGNKWNTKKMVSYREMLKIIAQSYPIEKIIKLKDDKNDTSKAFKIEGFKGQFGFITSMSEHFCNTCNRVRLTADGNLKVCLFGNAEVSLRDALRNNMNQDELIELISSAVKRKKAKHAGMENLPNLKNRPMILIGGRFHHYKSSSRYYYEQKRLASNQNNNNNNNDDNDAFKSEINLWNQYKDHYEKSKNGSFIETTKPKEFQFDSPQPSESTDSAGEFTHFDSQTNRPKQVDISEKLKSSKVRVASVTGYIQLNRSTFRALVENKLKKGNALIVAQLAGIQASKQASNLIPLCHQIQLDACDINFTLDNDRCRIYCEAICKSSLSKTGVEMESFTACTISLLTVYDMCKAVQKDATINDIKLNYKYGGKSDFSSNNP